MKFKKEMMQKHARGVRRPSLSLLGVLSLLPPNALLFLFLYLDKASLYSHK
jgi:hypothetical protein